MRVIGWFSIRNWDQASVYKNLHRLLKLNLMLLSSGNILAQFDCQTTLLIILRYNFLIKVASPQMTATASSSSELMQGKPLVERR